MSRPPSPSAGGSSKPSFQLEAELIRQGFGRVAGVDEAGRGPLAGPVVAAAVILDPAFTMADRLDDSKKLSPALRETLLEEIFRQALAVGVGRAEPEEIDQINILQAALLAMRRAVESLTPSPVFVLVDGPKCPTGLSCPTRGIVGGDGKSLSIAAASIVAKVTRDREMARLALEYPGYGWERNQAYPTKEHLEAIQRLGITPLHRRSFGPVRKLLEGG